MQGQQSEHPCDGVSRLRRTNDTVGAALEGGRLSRHCEQTARESQSINIVCAVVVRIQGKSAILRVQLVGHAAVEADRLARVAVLILDGTLLAGLDAVGSHQLETSKALTALGV